MVSDTIRGGTASVAAMGRRGGTALVALGAITVLGGCRDHTVDLRFRPATGTTYEYRDEIEATLSRSLDGEEPEVTELDTVLLVDQTILTADADGARVEVELRRDDGPATTAMVVLDRAGSLQAVEAVEGLAADAFGASGQSLFGSAPLALPKGQIGRASWRESVGQSV